jgi:post-segregation antitoxin (ccd killing protein)
MCQALRWALSPANPAVQDDGKEQARARQVRLSSCVLFGDRVCCLVIVCVSWSSMEVQDDRKEQARARQVRLSFLLF